MAALNIWDEILVRVSGKVNSHTFYKWFEPTRFVADAGSSITVQELAQPQLFRRDCRGPA
jgi:hypothetical protein